MWTAAFSLITPVMAVEVFLFRLLGPVERFTMQRPFSSFELVEEGAGMFSMGRD